MRKIRSPGYRFPPEIIHQAIRLCLRFTLSFRDVEDLLAKFAEGLGEPATTLCRPSRLALCTGGKREKGVPRWKA